MILLDSASKYKLHFNVRMSHPLYTKSFLIKFEKK